jgi:hypothetical protein
MEKSPEGNELFSEEHRHDVLKHEPVTGISALKKIVKYRILVPEKVYEKGFRC